MRDKYTNDFLLRRKIINELVYESNDTSKSQFRMNRYAFSKLCYLLEHRGLKEKKHMMVDEQVRFK